MGEEKKKERLIAMDLRKRDGVFTLTCLFALLQVLAVRGGDGLVVPARRFVPAVRAAPIPPAALVTELDNACVNENVTLVSGKATALVLIDVWDDHADAALYENQNLRVLPLLALARRQGWLVVHAPSENRETPMIQVLPGEILVTGEDGTPNSSSLCFPHLVQNGVHKVLMAGYDTNFCVLDKPCSTIRTSSAAAANSSIDMEVVLVRDATLPQSQWYLNDWYSHMMSVNMIEAAPWLPDEEKRFIRSVTVQALVRAAGVPPSSPIYANATTALKYPFQTAGSSDAKRPAAVPDLRGPGAAAALATARGAPVSRSAPFTPRSGARCQAARCAPVARRPSRPRSASRCHRAARCAPLARRPSRPRDTGRDP